MHLSIKGIDNLNNKNKLIALNCLNLIFSKFTKKFNCFLEKKVKKSFNLSSEQDNLLNSEIADKLENLNLKDLNSFKFYALKDLFYDNSSYFHIQIKNSLFYSHMNKYVIN